MLGNNLINAYMVNNHNLPVQGGPSSRRHMNIQKSNRMQPEIDNINNFEVNRFEQQQLPPVDQEQ